MQTLHFPNTQKGKKITFFHISECDYAIVLPSEKEGNKCRPTILFLRAIIISYMKCFIMYSFFFVCFVFISKLKFMIFGYRK